MPFRRSDGAPSKALDVLGWTTPGELTFLHDFLRDEYTGSGAAVELGCAFGRSTVAMAAGLAANPRASRRTLEVYDLLRLDWFLHRELDRAGLAADLSIGDSFEGLVQNHLRPWKKRVRLHPGDICRAQWRGGSIEFLFVDIMKSWDTAAAVMRTFYPALAPGALLVHQDYKHPFAPQVLLTHHRLRQYFEPAWDVCGDGSASVAFRLLRAIPAPELEAAFAAGLCDLASYSIGELEAVFDTAVALVAASPEVERARLLAARFVLFGELLAGRPEFLAGAAEVGAPVRDWFVGQVAFLGLPVSAPDTPETLELERERNLLRRTLHLIEGSRCGRLMFGWWRLRKWLRGERL